MIGEIYMSENMIKDFRKELEARVQQEDFDSFYSFKGFSMIIQSDSLPNGLFVKKKNIFGKYKLLYHKNQHEVDYGHKAVYGSFNEMLEKAKQVLDRCGTYQTKWQVREGTINFCRSGGYREPHENFIRNSNILFSTGKDGEMDIASTNIFYDWNVYFLNVYMKEHGIKLILGSKEYVYNTLTEEVYLRIFLQISRRNKKVEPVYKKEKIEEIKKEKRMKIVKEEEGQPTISALNAQTFVLYKVSTPTGGVYVGDMIEVNGLGRKDDVILFSDHSTYFGRKGRKYINLTTGKKYMYYTDNDKATSVLERVQLIELPTNETVTIANNQE